jgi:hypothetical protein
MLSTCIIIFGGKNNDFGGYHDWLVVDKLRLGIIWPLVVVLFGSLETA